MSDTPSTPHTPDDESAYMAMMAARAAIEKAASPDSEAVQADLMRLRERVEKATIPFLAVAVEGLRLYMADPTRAHDLKETYHALYVLEGAVKGLLELQGFHSQKGAA